MVFVIFVDYNGSFLASWQDYILEMPLILLGAHYWSTLRSPFFTKSMISAPRGPFFQRNIAHCIKYSVCRYVVPAFLKNQCSSGLVSWTHWSPFYSSLCFSGFPVFCFLGFAKKYPLFSMEVFATALQFPAQHCGSLYFNGFHSQLLLVLGFRKNKQRREKIYAFFWFIFGILPFLVLVH